MPEAVIATETVISHRRAVVTKPDMQVSQATRDEMRPERIGYRMMLLREALEMKPSEIADTLGIERTYWSRFEGGKRPLTEPFAIMLVERFGVTLDFLVLGRWSGLPLELAEKMRAVQREKR